MASRTTTTNQTGAAQSASKKTVLCVFHNDLVDSDNLTSAVVWAKMVQSAQKEHGKDAVKSFFVFEPHRVNLGIRRVKGTDIPFILMPMCNALFKKGGLVEQHKREIENYDGFAADLKKVLDRHETNLASTVVRADLTPNLVKKIVKCEPIMKALRAIPYKFVSDTVDNAWIETQLNKCVPTTDPKTWKEDSTLAAKLVVQDFVKTLRGVGVVGQQDPFYLDVDVLDKLNAPLCRHMEHPEWLVNNPPLVKEYMEVMAVSGLSKDQVHQKVKTLVAKYLEPDYQKAIHHIPSTYDPIVKAGQKAEKIFFFGGSSMTILDRLVAAGLGPKIDFTGQGGTKTPQLNLTGNTFNWDLNPSAAYRVLTKQAENHAKISSFQIGTTELGKSVAFDGDDVTAIAGTPSHSLGRRIAAYGVVGNRVNPEKCIRAPADYADYFKEGIFCPDLAALFSAYAPEKFSKHFSKEFFPTKMWIVETKPGSQVVDRVRFGDDNSSKDPAKPEQLTPCKSTMKLWLAKTKPANSPGPWMVRGTAAIADECAKTLKANVNAVINAQAGTTGSTATATGQTGGVSTANGTTPVRKPTGGVSTANGTTPVRKPTGGAPNQSLNGQQPKPSGSATPHARPTGPTPQVSNQIQPKAQPRQPANTNPQVRPTGGAPPASGGSNGPAASRLVSRPAPTKTTRQTSGSTN